MLGIFQRGLSVTVTMHIWTYSMDPTDWLPDCTDSVALTSPIQDKYSQG